MRPSEHHLDWLRTGYEYFEAVLEVLDAAKRSIGFEMYIFEPGQVADRIREALVRAARRGVRVQVLLDYLGSSRLPRDYWATLVEAGGEFRWFNPSTFRPIRNHRKSVVCDGVVVIFGGFNVADQYEGDGVREGWRDLGARVTGPVASEFGVAFDRMYAAAGEPQRWLARFRRAADREGGEGEGRAFQLLLGGPGRGANAIARALLEDLEGAKRVRILVPYLLPELRFRRAFRDVIRRGGSVELVVPGRSDVPISRSAAHNLYPRILRSGVKVREYQPQVLHAKLYLIDEVVYAGSCNLDVRSLHLNYELLVRMEDSAVMRDAEQYYLETRERSEAVVLREWQRKRGYWRRLCDQWSYFVLSKLDPYVTRWMID